MNYNSVIMRKIINVENWNIISLDTMKFLFLEAEKSLQATIQTNVTNRQAAYRIMGILLPLVAVSTGYLFTHFDWPLFWPSVVFTVIESLGALVLILAVRSQSIMGLGTDPEDSIKDGYFVEYDTDKAEQWQSVAVMLQHCHSIQDKIDHNRIQNTYIAKKVNLCVMLSAVFGPLIFVIASLLAFYR